MGEGRYPGECCPDLLHLSSDFVVDPPHDLGWSGDPMPLEKGEELVLLPEVVVVNA